MVSDTDDIEELREQAQWFEDQGWSSQAEEIWQQIEEREEQEELSTRERALNQLAENRTQEEHGDEIEELQEKLAWYEQRGWTSQAEKTRDELTKYLD